MKQTPLLGMWHRPFEKNLEEVKMTCHNLFDMGITSLFVETYFNGQLIYPSEVCLLPMHPFVGDYGPYGNNLLQALIETGKQYGIEIHAWVENFFVGRFERIEDSMWFQHDPEWLLINRDGSYLQKNEVNYLFLDPANPDVRQYTLNLYQEMMTIKGLASLHLDYIRYPLVYNIKPPMIADDVGYTPSLMTSFQSHHPIEGSLHEALTQDHHYQAWCQHKMMVITRFVQEVYALTQQENLQLSIAIFGDPDHAKKHKMQAWDKWIDEGWINIIIPMAYYQQSQRVMDEVTRLKAIVNDRATVYAGIAPAFMGLDRDEHAHQLHACREANVQGIIMFATQNYLTHSFMGLKPNHEVWKSWFQSWRNED